MTRPTPGKIVCVGRNYAAHARELGNELPSQPMLFFKPPSAVLASGESIAIPPEAGRVYFEGEIALVIGRRARKVSGRDARDFIAAITFANDVSARELQKSDGQWGR